MAGFGFSADCVTRSRRNLPGIFLQFFLAAPQLPSTYVSSWLLFRFHTRYETSGRVISTSQRPILDNTQRLSVADIHDAKRIRTTHCSKRAATHPRLWWRGPWERHWRVYTPLTPTWVRRADMNPLDDVRIPKTKIKLWTSKEFEQKRRGKQSAWSPRLVTKIHKTSY